jgi:gamma-glutamyltranspeptidase/glutathione hydrolase
MLSSQTPTIVVKNERVHAVTGSPGGRTIPSTVLWVVLNLEEFGLSPADAVDAPRSHHAWFPDVLTLEGASWSATTRAALEEMGHTIRMGGIQGDAHTIVVDPTSHRCIGAPDHRRETAKAAGE